MKIKNSFVTNSSSTAYVVAVPLNFEAEQEDILSKFEYHDYDREGLEETFILFEFEECMKLLKKGDNVSNHGSLDHRIFYSIVDICEERGFILSILDLNSEGNTLIQGIEEEDMNSWFVDTQLQKIKIEVDR